MKRFKLQAMAGEFPWLQELLGEELYKVDSIRVKRMDRKVLESIPSTYHWDGSAGCTDRRERIHFVLQDGSFIRDAVRPAKEWGSNYAHSQSGQEDGEAVLEAIDRLGVVDSLAYVVEERNLLDDWQGKDYRQSHTVVIYKPHKHMGLKFFLANAQADAWGIVRDQVEGVNDALTGYLWHKDGHAGEEVYEPFAGSIQELTKELRGLSEAHQECECCLPAFLGAGPWAGFQLQVEPETRELSWTLSAWRAEMMGQGYQARDLGAIGE